MIIQHGQGDRDHDDADETADEEPEAARRINLRQQEHVEEEDLRLLDGEIVPDLELPVQEVRDDRNQQDPDPEAEDRTLPQPRRGQLGDELGPDTMRQGRIAR